jgi:hypothetical protein
MHKVVTFERLQSRDGFAARLSPLLQVDLCQGLFELSQGQLKGAQTVLQLLLESTKAKYTEHARLEITCMFVEPAWIVHGEH